MATFVRGAVGAACSRGLITAPLARAAEDHRRLVRRQLGRRVPRLRRRALHPGDRRAGIARGRHLDHDAGQAPAAEGRAHHRRGLAGRWHQRAGRAGGRAGHAGPGGHPEPEKRDRPGRVSQGRGRLCGQLRLLLAGHRLQHARGQAAAGQLEGPVAARIRRRGGLPSPANSSGVPFVFFLARVWSVDPSNLAPLYAKLATLDTALYFDSSGAATNAYQSGEAVIGAHFNVGAWDLIDKGLPIGFAVPRKAPGPPTPGCTWSRARRTRPPRSASSTPRSRRRPRPAWRSGSTWGRPSRTPRCRPTWRASCPGAPKARCRT